MSPIAICVGCGLDIDSNGKLQVQLRPNGGIACDNSGDANDGLFINFTQTAGPNEPSSLGCGIKADATGRIATNSNSDSIATAESDSTGVVVVGSGPTAGQLNSCGPEGQNGLICDATSGKLWAPGKLGVYGVGQQSVRNVGANLGSYLSPLVTPANFGAYSTDQIFGNNGAQALCWEFENNTCHPMRGIINANVQLPVFFVKRGEIFRLALWERLNYKAALNGVAFSGPWALQSQQIVDLSWMVAGGLGGGLNFPAGSGMAYTNVMFDFSNVAVDPGQVVRGESVVTINRLAAGPDSNPGAVDNPFFNVGGTNGPFFQHEYRVTVAGGHTIVASIPAGVGGTIANNVVVGGTPCFFNPTT